MNQQQQMIEELIRQMPARRVLTPEVMPQGGGMPGMGGPVPRLPNMPIETTGGMVPMGAAAAGMGMGMIPGMVGAGMLYPSMIGGETGPEAAMGQIDRLSTQQGRVLPTPPYSPQESSAMIDSVLQGPTKRPKMELYSAMEPEGDQIGGSEMASGGGVKPGKAMKRTTDANPQKAAKKSAMQPEPMDDGMLDELINKPSTVPTAPKKAPGRSSYDVRVDSPDDQTLYEVLGAKNADEAARAGGIADYALTTKRKRPKTSYTDVKRKKTRTYEGE